MINRQMTTAAVNRDILVKQAAILDMLDAADLAYSEPYYTPANPDDGAAQQDHVSVTLRNKRTGSSLGNWNGTSQELRDLCTLVARRVA